MEDIKLALKKLKVSQLKNIARYYNMHKRISFSKLKKAELIDALFEHMNYLPALDIDYTQPRGKPKQPKLQRQISEESTKPLTALEKARLELEKKVKEQKEIEKVRQARGERLAPIEFEQTEAEKRRRKFEESQSALRQRLAQLEAQLFM